MGIGARIRELRLSQGLSQTELGKKVGLSQKAITTYERETREPGIETIKALAAVFQVSVESLFKEGHKGQAAPKPSKRLAKNKRSLKAQQLFETLTPTEQRIVLKQIELMAKAAK